MTMAADLPGWVFRYIVENAGDAVVYADRDGVIRLWNRGARLLFGFTPEEALGESLDIIIPEHLRERHWEGYRRVMASGATAHRDELLSVPALTRDKGRIFVDFTVVLVEDRDGGPLGVAAILREKKVQKSRG